MRWCDCAIVFACRGWGMLLKCSAALFPTHTAVWWLRGRCTGTILRDFVRIERGGGLASPGPSLTVDLCLDMFALPVDSVLFHFCSHPTWNCSNSNQPPGHAAGGCGGHGFTGTHPGLRSGELDAPQKSPATPITFFWPLSIRDGRALNYIV